MDIFEKTLPSSVLEKEDVVKINSNIRTIEVFCRIRPMIDKNRGMDYNITQEQTILELNEHPELLMKLGAVHNYRFTTVFGESCNQFEIFGKVCLPMLKDLFSLGLNILIFTYGVTNAGKTYTMVGDDENPGLLRRTLEWIFILKNDLQNPDLDEDKKPLLLLKDFFALTNNEFIKENNFSGVKVSLQCFEIYNDDVFDLFSPKNKRNKLKLKEGEDKRTIVEGITTISIENISSIKAALKKCLSARSIKDTLLNHSSSRSHCIFRIKVEFCFENEKEELIFERSINIVDLAGAERAKRTDNCGLKLKEANKINQSLSCLGRCLTSLRDGTLPPYRETKLTKFLAEFFLEQSRISMVTNINLEEQEFEETVRVLNYSALARQVPPLVSKYENRKSFNVFSLKKPHDKNNVSFLAGPSEPNENLHSLKVEVLKELKTKIENIENKLDKICDFLFMSKENKEECELPVDLLKNDSALVKNEGTMTCPSFTTADAKIRAQNIVKKFKKNYMSNKNYIYYTEKLNAPLFKKHGDYSEISTKDLAIIISEREKIEKLSFEKF